MSSIFRKLKHWRFTRALHRQKYDKSVQISNLLEELHELSVAKTEHEEIDAYCDLAIFSINAIAMMGYSPKIALEEAIEEISSRKGNVVNGKFQKFTDAEHKELWYTADYSKAKVVSEKPKVLEVKCNYSEAQYACVEEVFSGFCSSCNSGNVEVK